MKNFKEYLIESSKPPRELNKFVRALEKEGYKFHSTSKSQGEVWYLYKARPGTDNLDVEFTNVLDAGVVGWAFGKIKGNKFIASNSGSDDVSDLSHLLESQELEEARGNDAVYRWEDINTALMHSNVSVRGIKEMMSILNKNRRQRNDPARLGSGRDSKAYWEDINNGLIKIGASVPTIRDVLSRLKNKEV